MAAGANLFALLSLDPDLSLASWRDYHDWVQTLDGKAAEPLATGWAASSFLNRCASTISRGWLFDRNSLTPELDQPSYVAVLDQMLATSKLYQGEPKTPMQIWADLRAGKLRVAIGFQTSVREESDSDAGDIGEQFDISVLDGPRESQSDRIWFDARCPLVAISSGCRQSEAARRLAGWMTGGEGIANVRGQVTEFSATRTAPDGLTDSSSSAYARWLVNRLQTRQVLPSLVLPAADRYHAALDQQIQACLSGNVDPQAALKSVVEQWQAITDQVGREQQVVAWKKVLGFGVA